MINAEYDELDTGELDLADTDNLPWLESDEEDADAGGLDTGQVLGFATGLVLLLGAVVGGVWYVSNKAGDAGVPEGGVIAAPEGPIKERPDSAGGKTFAGTGNVAPLVGEGASRPAVVAAGETPPLTGPVSAPSPTTGQPAATKPVPVTAAPATSAADLSGVGVQLAAYGTRARAEQGWVDAQRRTEKLAGLKYRVVEGKVDIGTVYRLQVVTGSRAEAERLCAALKSDGLDCQIK
jgi:hypothetical protein